MALLLNPTILLAAILAAGYASIFHLWTGRSKRDLLLFLFVAGTGFALGQWAGQSLRWEVLWIGQLCTLEATLASLLALFLVKALMP
jgi:hypothetical protein